MLKWLISQILQRNRTKRVSLPLSLSLSLKESCRVFEGLTSLTFVGQASRLQIQAEFLCCKRVAERLSLQEPLCWLLRPSMNELDEAHCLTADNLLHLESSDCTWQSNLKKNLYSNIRTSIYLTKEYL